MPETRLITSRELAEALGVSVLTVQRLASQQKLPSHRVGTRYRFDLHEVKQYLAQQPTVTEGGQMPLVLEALDEIRSEIKAARNDIQRLSGEDQR